MNIKRTAALCLFFVALISSRVPTARAQAAQADDKAAEESARAAELERKALKLLDEIGDDARSLKLVENRARVEVATADLLWPRDEKRAREIVADAQAGVAAAAALPRDDPRGEQQAQEFLSMRREIVQLVAQHDPQLALDFLRGTRAAQPAPPPGSAYYRQDEELALEASLAEQVVARDPKQALRIAEETLSRGFSTQLVSVLERLRFTDPAAAAALANDIAHRLRASDLTGGFEAINVANYLLRATRPPDAAAASQRPNANAAGAVTVSPGVVVNTVASGERYIALDEQARRDLLSLMANAAVSVSNDARRRGVAQSLASSLQQYVPEIERTSPAQAQALRRLAPDTQRVMSSPAGAAAQSREYMALMQTGSVDALLDAASKAPPEMREQLYRSAAYKAMNDGAGERARQIVSEHFENPQQRGQMLREIDQQMFWRASSAGDVEQARTLIARAPRPEDRAQMLTYLARSVAGKGDKEGALRLLEEAWNQIGGRARNQQQFASQLEAAQVFAQVAPDRAFEIVETSISQLNDLLAAAATVDGFGQQSFDQDELRAQGGYTWTALINQCGAVLSALAREDFDRAVTTADHLQRTEARLSARLSVARGVLAPNADPSGRVRAFGRGGSRPVVIRQ